MTRSSAASLVAPFSNALNRTTTKDVRALVESAAAPEWHSFSGEETSKGRGEFIHQVAGFGKLIPDQQWAVNEVFADGDRIIVRSAASGTPAGNSIRRSA